MALPISLPKVLRMEFVTRSADFFTYLPTTLSCFFSFFSILISFTFLVDLGASSSSVFCSSVNFSYAEYRSTGSLYLQDRGSFRIAFSRVVSMQGAIKLCGGRIPAFSTIVGIPSLSRKETSASPVPRFIMASSAVIAVTRKTSEICPCRRRKCQQQTQNKPQSQELSFHANLLLRDSAE